jgi:LPS O-antigen subunit length determinant protein (WzzB/FepE family)
VVIHGTKHTFRFGSVIWGYQGHRRRVLCQKLGGTQPIKCTKRAILPFYNHFIPKYNNNYSKEFLFLILNPTKMDYSLFAIIRTIGNGRRTILKMVLIAVVTGIAIYLLVPTKYEADVIFILKNPIYADRSNVYNYEAKFLDYVANDDDVDRLITMASSDSLQNNIIRTMHLAAAYDYDSTDAEQVHKLKKYFKRHLKIYRNEFKNVVLTYTDKDPVRAAAVANLCVDLLEVSLRGFYNGMRKNMHTSIMNKVHQEDSAIAVLTDSLVRLREQYGIFDIISPSRYNIMLSSMKENGHAGYARGLEQVQNIESVKDELVGDRAKHISLANQYSTGTEVNEMPLTHIVQAAKPPFKQTVRDIFVITGISACLGLLFGVVQVLMAEYFKRRSTNAK